MVKLEINSHQKMELLNITGLIDREVRKSGVVNGQVLLFVPHTTAGLTVNENADPDVIRDLLIGLKELSPVRSEYRHREGNSHAHLLSTLVGQQKQFIISEGKLQLGIWQGIFFCEFDGPRKREVWLQISG